MGFRFANKNKSLFLLALLSFGLLGFFDAYYLYLEKQFCRNFNRLTELIYGFNEDEEEVIKHVKGNFLVLEKFKSAQVLNQYLSALLSWADLPYIVVFSANLAILIIS
ncbi:hypothetical protein [Nostoc sp.]|uniref:hypothetical protein n=1 Tax=Nostoc sp. TaxID=1180 RepID=UPI002FF81372